MWAYFVVDTNRHDQPSPAAGPDAGSSSLLQTIRATPEDVVDVFVYVVVLNLAIEYLPAVLSESFTLSLITAVLLKLSLELVLIVKARAVAGNGPSPPDQQRARGRAARPGQRSGVGGTGGRGHEQAQEQWPSGRPGSTRQASRSATAG